MLIMLWLQCVNNYSNNSNNYYYQHKILLFPRFYVHMVNSLDRSQNSILMGLMADVLLDWLCRTTVGTAEMILKLQEKYGIR